MIRPSILTPLLVPTSFHLGHLDLDPSFLGPGSVLEAGSPLTHPLVLQSVQSAVRTEEGRLDHDHNSQNA